MLKIIIGSGKEDTVEFAGSGAELFHSISVAILSLRKALAASDQRAAAAFRITLQRAIRDPDFWSLDLGADDFISIIQPNGGKGGRS